MLEGLRDLMDFYVPALYLLGVQVRRLTWEGGIGGRFKGDYARRVLETCLALQVHLAEDWTGKQEYCRTLSIALLTWLPWYNDLPGCCFAEEACEALLSRMSSRCVAHNYLTSYTDIWRLFVSMPTAAPEAEPTAGLVKKTLVWMVVCRVRRMLRSPLGFLFPKLQNARQGQWMAVMPDGFRMPRAPTTTTVSQQSFNGVLLNALALLTARGQPSPAIVTQANHLIFIQDDPVVMERLAEAQRKVQQLGGRQARARQARHTPSTDGQQPPTRRRRQTSTHTTTLHQDHDDQEDQQDQQRPEGTSQGQPSPPPPDMSEDSGSLYNFRQGDDDLSENWRSFGDTGSEDSLEDLMQTQRAVWSTLEDDWVNDPTVDPLAQRCQSSLLQCSVFFVFLKVKNAIA